MLLEFGLWTSVRKQGSTVTIIKPAEVLPSDAAALKIEENHSFV